MFFSWLLVSNIVTHVCSKVITLIDESCNDILTLGLFKSSVLMQVEKIKARL